MTSRRYLRVRVRASVRARVGIRARVRVRRLVKCPIQGSLGLGLDLYDFSKRRSLGIEPGSVGFVRVRVRVRVRTNL